MDFGERKGRWLGCWWRFCSLRQCVNARESVERPE